jgi:hypothetical protein
MPWLQHEVGKNIKKVGPMNYSELAWEKFSFAKIMPSKKKSMATLVSRIVTRGPIKGYSRDLVELTNYKEQRKIMEFPLYFRQDHNTL